MYLRDSSNKCYHDYNMIKVKHKLILLISWTALVLILVTMPLKPYIENGEVSFKDKLVHIIIFGVFSYLFLSYLNDFKKKKYYLISFAVAVFYSLFAEFLQLFLPTRNASTWDFAAGLFGIITALLFVYFLYGKKSSKT